MWHIPLGGNVIYSTITFHSKCLIPLWVFHCSGMWSGIRHHLLYSIVGIIHNVPQMGTHIPMVEQRSQCGKLHSQCISNCHIKATYMPHFYHKTHGCHKCAPLKILCIPNSTPQNGSNFLKPILVTYHSTPIHWWLKYIGDIFYNILLVMRKDTLIFIHITHYVSLSFNFEICLNIFLFIIYSLNHMNDIIILRFSHFSLKFGNNNNLRSPPP